MGPLAGTKVVELAGIGPGPFCCMALADMGADVVRVDRTGPTDLGLPADPRFAVLNRSRRSIAVDLKSPQGVAVVRRLIAEADILVEGFRPGVTERLGLGPEDCRALNPRMVYGRMTGWGQNGPMAQAAGHDLNYIALAGALAEIGPRGGPPVPPLNLLGDFGGGALYLAFGLVCALLEARRSGEGQVVDAAIVDGVAHLLADVAAKRAAGTWSQARGEHLLAGGAPFYTLYATSDGHHVTVAAIEARFFRELLERLGVEHDRPQHDRASWPALQAKIAAAFASRTRAEWIETLEGTDACFAPVLTLEEARRHRHLAGRDVFVEVDGIPQPAPAPRFSRSTAAKPGPPARPGQHTDAILAQLGFTAAEVAALRAARAVA
jgi:alpha-methylacyl-CoA racemase